MHKLLIIIIVAFTVSCNSQPSRKCDYLSRLNNFNIEDCNKWVSNLEMPNDVDELLIEYKNESGDTLKHLQIIVKFNMESDNIIDEKLFISIIKDSLMQRAKLVGDYDTSFVYIVPLNNKYDFTFIVGKYEYMYSGFDFTMGQRLYYEEHRDSLKKVRGNNLPPLPELEYEKKLFIFEEERVD